MIRTRKRRQQTSFISICCGESCSMPQIVVLIIILILPIILYMTDVSPDLDVQSISTITSSHTERSTATIPNNQDKSSTITPHQSSTTQTTTVDQHDPPQQQKSFLRQKKANGFHSIHVYHGPDDAIDSLPTNKAGLQNRPYPKGSQVDQDKIVAALAVAFEPSRKQPYYFVDLAANDALQLSNTLLLEQKGWKGLCVEPNPIYWFRLAHRQCDIAAAFVGGNHDMEQVTVSLDNKALGGIVGENMDNTKDVVSRHELLTEQRYTISLKTLFDDFGVPKSIDYLSLDVEGAEELIMGDFPFDSYTIHFLTVERPKPKLQTILKSHQYQFVTMLIHWGETLWVHESVVKQMGMDKIQQIVRANSGYVDKKPQPGLSQFYIETGEYKRAWIS